MGCQCEAIGRALVAPQLAAPLLYATIKYSKRIATTCPSGLLCRCWIAQIPAKPFCSFALGRASRPLRFFIDTYRTGLGSRFAANVEIGGRWTCLLYTSP